MIKNKKIYKSILLLFLISMPVLSGQQEAVENKAATGQMEAVEMSGNDTTQPAKEGAKTAVIAKGYCGKENEEGRLLGENLRWTLDVNGIFTIRGEGEMACFDMDIGYMGTRPWKAYKNKIKKIVLDGNITNIGDEAFKKCKNLETIQWCDGIAAIGNYAFTGCKNLQALEIPRSVTTVEGGAFAGCSSLQEVYLPVTVREWGAYVFAGCKGLKKVEAEEGIDFTADYNKGALMFDSCTALEELLLPDSVVTIPEGFYCGCFALKTYRIPKNVVCWGSFPPGAEVERFVLPETVEYLADFAFATCKNLKEVILGEQLLRIGGSVFAGCDNLKTVELPSSIKKISNGAFDHWTGLETITIPDTLQLEYSDAEMKVKDIDFYDCINLKEVNLPDNLGVGYSFWGCKSLEKVVFPKGYDSYIGFTTFKECTSLKSITIPSKKIKRVDGDALKDVPKNAVIYVPKSKLKKYKKLFKKAGSKVNRYRWRAIA